MEFAERGSLFQGKDVEEPYSESDTRNLFRDIVSGLEFMHSHQVAHRDIKPENCLRMRDGTVKLSDFGASLHFHSVAEENVTSTEGTAAFMAPEMCQGLFSTTDQAPSFSVCNADIWSAGVSLFNLLFGRVPFDARSVMKMYEAIVQQPLKIPERPAISAECAELLSRMLEKDPAKRANWAEIRNHPWLTEFGKRPMPPMPGADDSTAQSTTAGIVMTSVVLPGASD
jgi:[calcium/calmodulin-dependent protein kinase] kinase